MKLNIVPAGTLSPEIQSLGKSVGYTETEFYDDQKAGCRKPIDIPEGEATAIAIGNPQSKRKIQQSLMPKLHYPVLIHPSVVLMEPAETQIGEGTLITALCVITTNVKIGRFNLINLQTNIGHDCVIGDYCSIMPGVSLSGGVVVEDEVFIGTNATVLPYLKIGKGATIGAGAVVTKDVPPGKTYVGIPAKEIAKP